MSDTRSDRLVWSDLETFGLDAEADPIIEAGFRITDLNLNTLSEFSVLIWEDGLSDYAYRELVKKADAGHESSKYVLDMHENSKLWADARFNGTSFASAIEQIHAWMDENDMHGEDPLCGSSVRFDRGMLEAQMFPISERLHYRIIDISGIKELCARYNPSVSARLKEVTQPKKLHRAMPDLDDTIGELKFYLDNFLFVGDEFC